MDIKSSHYTLTHYPVAKSDSFTFNLGDIDVRATDSHGESRVLVKKGAGSVQESPLVQAAIQTNPFIGYPMNIKPDLVIGLVTMPTAWRVNLLS